MPIATINSLNFVSALLRVKIYSYACEDALQNKSGISL